MTKPKDNCTKILNIRLTEEDHTTIKVKAAQNKMSIKEYFLFLVENDGPKIEEKPEVDIEGQLSF
jgi:predicted HicB family RNase H-like nuclease